MSKYTTMYNLQSFEFELIAIILLFSFHLYVHVHLKPEHACLDYKYIIVWKEYLMEAARGILYLPL